MKKQMKNNKAGVTLIALVVTIIVLLLLAGISIQMLTGDNGILNNATQAKEASEEEQIRERIKLAYHSALIHGISGENGNITKPILKGELENEFAGKEVTITDSADKKEWIISVDNVSVSVKAGIEGPIEQEVYSLGQEVTVGEEQFYVIEENDTSSKDKITLLSKYMLDSTMTFQANTWNYMGSRQFCTGSSGDKGYWGTNGVNYPLNVNEIESERATVYNIAVAYGNSKGGKGRLLTKSEAESLFSNNTMMNIILGVIPGEIEDGYEYWLGTACNDEGIYTLMAYNYTMYGGLSPINNMSFYESTGVRPVIEISKELVSSD